MTEKTTDFEVTSSEEVFDTLHLPSEQAVSGPPEGPALTRLWSDQCAFHHTRRAGSETRPGSRAGGLKILAPGSLSATNYCNSQLVCFCLLLFLAR